MAQSSGPIAQGTAADRQFTDVMWRDMFGEEPGVVGDLDGTAYRVALPTDSDVAQVGSTTQTSTARVAGFAHRIPAGSPEGITIPAAVGSARTDIIALRYNPANTGQPGPVRLTRIEGTASGLPAYDSSPPGIEDLPLWAITRRPGQALSQATIQRLFPRITPMRDLPTGAPLPTSSPLGTRIKQGHVEYVREIGSAGTPVWVPAGNTGTLTFRRMNYPVPHNSPLRVVSPWAVGKSIGGHFDVLSNGQIRLSTEGIVAISVMGYSDSGFRGHSYMILDVPGGTETHDLVGVENSAQRAAGYSEAGLLRQPVSWVGRAKPGQHIAVLVHQFSENSSEISYNFHGSINYIG